jgi:hypothetical protein
MTWNADLRDPETDLLIRGRAPKAFCDEWREEGHLLIGKRPQRIRFS